jgi:Transcriptional Coactivator p15 (PC4)
MTAPRVIAKIETTRSNSVRVQLSTWRGETKLELRPYCATIADVPMPCGPGVTLPIEKLGELLEALKAAGG